MVYAVLQLEPTNVSDPNTIQVVAGDEEMEGSHTAGLKLLCVTATLE